MTFSEPLRSPVNYTGIILVGPSQNLTLDTVTAKNHIIQVINATLDGPQRAIVGERPACLLRRAPSPTGRETAYRTPTEPS